jgi:hypothetical protein
VPPLPGVVGAEMTWREYSSQLKFAGLVRLTPSTTIGYPEGEVSTVTGT